MDSIAQDDEGLEEAPATEVDDPRPTLMPEVMQESLLAASSLPPNRSRLLGNGKKESPVNLEVKENEAVLEPSWPRRDTSSAVGEREDEPAGVEIKDSHC